MHYFNYHSKIRIPSHLKFLKLQVFTHGKKLGFVLVLIPCFQKGIHSYTYNSHLESFGVYGSVSILLLWCFSDETPRQTLSFNDGSDRREGGGKYSKIGLDLCQEQKKRFFVYGHLKAGHKHVS